MKCASPLPWVTNEDYVQTSKEFLSLSYYIYLFFFPSLLLIILFYALRVEKSMDVGTCQRARLACACFRSLSPMPRGRDCDCAYRCPHPDVRGRGGYVGGTATPLAFDAQSSFRACQASHLHWTAGRTQRNHCSPVAWQLAASRVSHPGRICLPDPHPL